MGVDDYNSSLKDRPSRWTEVKGEDEPPLTWGAGGSGFGTRHSTCLVLLAWQPPRECCRLFCRMLTCALPKGGLRAYRLEKFSFTEGLLRALMVLICCRVSKMDPSKTVFSALLWTVPQRNAGPRPSAQMCLGGSSGTR